MTNEELAVLIQAGERDKLLGLWKQVERFATKQARRWVKAIGEPAGVVLEDLQQAAFLALLNALERWEPECGTAVHHLLWHVPKEHLFGGLRAAHIPD